MDTFAAIGQRLTVMNDDPVLQPARPRSGRLPPDEVLIREPC